tara:strand:- start:236 stop:526 length:291 start_codon:yes stop_codon:yes gene_type:complete
MNGLDIVLINIISYLGGILSGLYIHNKMDKSKKSTRDNGDKDSGENKKVDKEYDVTQVYSSPVLGGAPMPSAPPPMNPNYMNSESPMKKRITITTE